MTNKGLISKIYKQPIQTDNKKKNKQFNQKTGRRPQQPFSKEVILMANRHMKRCSSLLIIREMQINNTMRYHLTPIRTAIIIKSTNSKGWRRYGKKETFLTVGGNVNWCDHYGRQCGGTSKN